MAVSRRLVVELQRALSSAQVLTDPAVTGSYAVEWTGRFAGAADVVVRPTSTGEVRDVMAVCAQLGVPVVPQGGRTGLVGGGVPQAGSVVLDTSGLGSLTIDSAGMVATAGAGVTIAAMNAAAAREGLRYVVDLASRDSATVGGTIATNAGGTRAMRLGDTRAQLVGVEAVLADGSVITSMPGLTRNNTGYHLPSLLCGSEGTLAIVTAAQLRLQPARSSRAAAMLGFNSCAAAVAAAHRLRLSPFVEAVELMRADGVRLVCDVASLPLPLRARHEVYLLVEAAAPEGMECGLLEASASLASVAEAAIGLDRAAVARLWAYRDRHTEAIATLGPAHKLDVTLPASSVAAFIDEVAARVRSAYPTAQVWLFGHVADGNVHVNVTDVDPDDDGVDDLVLRLVVDAGGSISTEHGIGRAKLPWLGLVRSPAELRLFQAIKGALDPMSLLNPGVLVPPVT